MRISLDGKKVEGDWCSFAETCGKGDGKTVEFKTPFPAKDARGLAVMRDYLIIEPDNVLRTLGDDGKVTKEEPDGYFITQTDPESPLSITFQRPPRLGVTIGVSVIGHRPNVNGSEREAFKILPMTTVISKRLDELLPAELRNRKRDELARLPAVQDMCRSSFMTLVSDWQGFINDSTNEPIPCNDATKKVLIDQTDAVVLGLFASDRARAIQRERMEAQKNDASD